MTGANSDLSFWSDIAAIIEATITSLAILFAGIWTYLIFIRERLGYPRLAPTIEVSDRTLESDHRYVHVEVVLKNAGTVVASSHMAELRLRQVMPLPAAVQEATEQNLDPVPSGRSEIEWPLVSGRDWAWDKGHFEIEPAESERLHADFFIDGQLEVAQFYFFMANAKKARKGLGWTVTKLHTFSEPERGDDEMAKEGNGNKQTWRPDNLQKKQQPPQKPQQQKQPKADGGKGGK